MSIIQEALRKAQRTGTRRDRDIVIDTPKRDIELKTEEAPANIRKSHKPKNILKPILYALVFLIPLSIISMKYFSTALLKAAANSSVPIPVKVEALQFTLPVIEKKVAAQQPALIEPAAIQKEDFTLAGIMHLEDGPRAIVNGSTVIEGDVVDGAVVTKITDSSVSLKKRNSEIVLYLK